jgi:1-acyl-sn-glycerol-3-phosphate acyltransferase
VTPLGAPFRLALRIFFRRREVAGKERVPAQGPVIFVLNHPNALIDPLCALCLIPRRVSFLAKAPLFAMPIIGRIVRAFDSLPVYRPTDQGQDPRRNRETFAAAHALLLRGGAIALFPEGTSHSDPKLRPLKTGAARIALGAASVAGAPLLIVPAGLYYTSKPTFRSDVLLYFGEPIPVAPGVLDQAAEPPREDVQALTNRLASALAEGTLSAEHGEAIRLVERAQRIFSAAGPAADEASLADTLALRRRFLAGYHLLRQRAPGELAALAARVERLELDLVRAGLAPAQLDQAAYRPARVAGYAARAAFVLALCAPLAAVGAPVHYPAYRLAGAIARRLSRGEDDLIATIKVLGGMLFFPLTWVAVAVAAGLRAGPAALGIALVLAPLSGVCALLLLERAAELAAATRALGFFLLRRQAFERLRRERDAIRAQIEALAQAVPEI